MRTNYDPWGRPTAQRRPMPQRQQSVPLDTALALRDRAEEAVAALEQTRRRLGDAERDNHTLREALTASRAALADAQGVQEELRRSLERSEALRQSLREVALEQPQEETVSNGPSDLEAQLEAAVTSLRADLANVRRHQEEAVRRARSEGRAEVLLPLVDTLDDLRRALAGMDDATSQGLRAMERRLVQRLETAGTQVLGEAGEAFDPERHDAVGTAPGPRDQVIQVASHGLIDDHGAVLRPARVLVGEGR